MRERFERRTKGLLPGLYRTARRLVAQPADAEDLVQDTYLKAFMAYERADIRGEADCRAWLARIMTNTFYDHCRRRKRTPESDVVSLAAARADEPAAWAEARQFAAAAQSAIAELPPEVRLVVVLFFSQEMTYKEIAMAVDCPLGTVMSRLYRGRRLLRQSLKDHAPENHQPPSAEVRRRAGPGKIEVVL